MQMSHPFVERYVFLYFLYYKCNLYILIGKDSFTMVSSKKDLSENDLVKRFEQKMFCFQAIKYKFEVPPL